MLKMCGAVNRWSVGEDADGDGGSLPIYGRMGRDVDSFPYNLRKVDDQDEHADHPGRAMTYHPPGRDRHRLSYCQ